MPIYEYKCKQCNEEFEKLVFGDGDRVQCPYCNGDKVERLMSVAAFKCNGNFVSTASSGGCAGCSSASCSSCK